MVSMFWRIEKFIEKESYLNNGAHKADTGQRVPWMGRLCALKQRDEKGLPRLFRNYLWTPIPLSGFYNKIPTACAGFHQQWTTEGTEKESRGVWSSSTLPSSWLACPAMVLYLNFPLLIFTQNQLLTEPCRILHHPGSVSPRHCHRCRQTSSLFSDVVLRFMASLIYPISFWKAPSLYCNFSTSEW